MSGCGGTILAVWLWWDNAYWCLALVGQYLMSGFGWTIFAGVLLWLTNTGWCLALVGQDWLVSGFSGTRLAGVWLQ